MSAAPKAGSPPRSASPTHVDFLPSKEPSPHSTLNPARPHAFQHHAATHPPLTSRKAESEATATDTDSDDTCSSDEFNWSDDEDAQSRKVAAEKKARRGRAIWLAFKKLARPVRSVHITTHQHPSRCAHPLFPTNTGHSSLPLYLEGSSSLQLYSSYSSSLITQPGLMSSLGHFGLASHGEWPAPCH